MPTDGADAGLTSGGALAGQVAVVTGGGRGVGRAIARRLAMEGVRVAVAARTRTEVEETAELIEHEGGTAIGLVLDVSDGAAVTDMVAEVEQRFGPIDLLVNNAAVVAPFGPPGRSTRHSGGGCCRSTSWVLSFARTQCWVA